MVMCLGSLGGLPCPENSPAFDVQFSRRAADGHFLAFGTEVSEDEVDETHGTVLHCNNGDIEISLGFI